MLANRLIAFLLVLSLLLIDGCLFLPVGHRAIPKEIYEADLAFIKLGITTKAEITERLGDQFLVFEERNVIAYQWKTETDFFFGVVGPQAGGADTFTYHQGYSLEIEFDSNDHVKGFQRIQLPHSRTTQKKWFSYH